MKRVRLPIAPAVAALVVALGAPPAGAEVRYRDGWGRIVTVESLDQVPDEFKGNVMRPPGEAAPGPSLRPLAASPVVADEETEDDGRRTGPPLAGEDEVAENLRAAEAAANGCSEWAALAKRVTGNLEVIEREEAKLEQVQGDAHRVQSEEVRKARSRVSQNRLDLLAKYPRLSSQYVGALSKAELLRDEFDRRADQEEGRRANHLRTLKGHAEKAIQALRMACETEAKQAYRDLK